MDKHFRRAGYTNGQNDKGWWIVPNIAKMSQGDRMFEKLVKLSTVGALPEKLHLKMNKAPKAYLCYSKSGYCEFDS